MSIKLQTLKTKFIDSNEKTVSAVINYIKYNAGVQEDFYSKIIVLLKLYLLSPSMNGVSERPASSMCRIKNWLGSTKYWIIACCFQHIQKNWWNKPKTMSPLYFVKLLKKEDLPLVPFVIQTSYSWSVDISKKWTY